MNVLRFAIFVLRQVLIGRQIYYVWLGFLFLLIALGLSAVAEQTAHGHIVTNMRDPVPWGVFIGTYAFFVGVAAAAVALVVPGYLYDWKPIKEIVILGEIIAISAVTICILFVMADLGHPERFWHLLPVLGKPNLPSSMIGMNVMILNGYLVLNLIIVTYLFYCSFTNRPYHPTFFIALIFVSIPAAISIHATTAFIFNVLPSRPYWNSAILVPRFIATALSAGPALMILAFEALRVVARLDIKQEALTKIAEMIAHVMFVNLLLFLAEVVTEYRSATQHSVHIYYYFEGLGDHVTLVPWAWCGVAFNLTAFALLVVPRTRNAIPTMNIACILLFIGIFIEKGIGLILPGLTPGTLGEIYEYVPSWVEVRIGIGVGAAGVLVFTLLTKIAIPLTLSELRQRHLESARSTDRWAEQVPPTRW